MHEWWYAAYISWEWYWISFFGWLCRLHHDSSHEPVATHLRRHRPTAQGPWLAPCVTNSSDVLRNLLWARLLANTFVEHCRQHCLVRHLCLWIRNITSSTVNNTILAVVLSSLLCWEQSGPPASSRTGPRPPQKTPPLLPLAPPLRKEMTWYSSKYYLCIRKKYGMYVII